jgi:hypothetical protein
LELPSERLAVEYSELYTTVTDNRSAKIITVINGSLDCYRIVAPNILTRTCSGKLIDTKLISRHVSNT